jgi:hypothetical protein
MDGVLPMKRIQSSIRLAVAAAASWVITAGVVVVPEFAGPPAIVAVALSLATTVACILPGHSKTLEERMFAADVGLAMVLSAGYAVTALDVPRWVPLATAAAGGCLLVAWWGARRGQRRNAARSQ